MALAAGQRRKKPALSMPFTSLSPRSISRRPASFLRSGRRDSTPCGSPCSSARSGTPGTGPLSYSDDRASNAPSEPLPRRGWRRRIDLRSRATYTRQQFVSRRPTRRSGKSLSRSARRYDRWEVARARRRKAAPADCGHRLRRRSGRAGLACTCRPSRGPRRRRSAPSVLRHTTRDRHRPKRPSECIGMSCRQG